MKKLIVFLLSVCVAASSTLRANAGVTLPNSKWPNGVVPIEFSPSFSKSQEQKIREAIQEIHDKTCIRFLQKESDDTDYIVVQKGSPVICNSYIGKNGWPQAINLGEFCMSRGIILHQLMHTLGFIDEHNRPDRDDFVRIHFGNIQEGTKHNFDKHQSYEVKLLNTEYAYDSIMHYHDFDFAKNHSIPTIVPYQQGVHLGGGEELSEIDVIRINRHYCGADRPTSTTREPPLQYAPVEI